jgi:hypothetical protein
MHFYNQCGNSYNPCATYCPPDGNFCNLNVQGNVTIGGTISASTIITTGTPQTVNSGTFNNSTLNGTTNVSGNFNVTAASIFNGIVTTSNTVTANGPVVLNGTFASVYHPRIKPSVANEISISQAGVSTYLIPISLATISNIFGTITTGGAVDIDLSTVTVMTGVPVGHQIKFFNITTDDQSRLFNLQLGPSVTPSQWSISGGTVFGVLTNQFSVFPGTHVELIFMGNPPALPTP